MRLVNKHFIYYLFLLMSSLSYSQTIEFKNISTRDGLPQSDVYDAVQDEIGYMWFATQGGGIAKYDGKNFNVYNEQNGLLSNYTNSLSIKKNYLFIGTNKGLSIYYKGKFTNYNCPKINEVAHLNSSTYLATEEGIYAFKNDFVIPLKINLKIDLSNIKHVTYFSSFYWIETQNEIWKTKTLNNPTSIKRVSKKERKIYLNRQNKYVNKYQKNSKFNSTQILKIYFDKQKNTWLLTKGNGVYQSVSNNFQHFESAASKKIQQITAIYNSNNSIWFSDSNNLFKHDSLGISTINTQNHQFKVTSITKDSLDNLWIGSKNNGIFIFRKKIDSTNTQKYNIERLYTENGLPNNQIQNIHIQKNTIWVSTKNKGIFKLDYDFNNGFVKKIRVFNKSNGLKDVALTSTLLHKKSIWYTTKNGALGFIKNNSVTHFSNILKQKSAISSIAFNNDRIFIGTFGNGIWNSKIDQLNLIKPINKTFLSSLNIYQLLFDQSNNLWVGSEKGLDKLIINNNKILSSKHFNVNDGFLGIETSINTAIKAKDNYLWFGTKNGITKYTPTNNVSKKRKPSVYFEKIKIQNQSIDSIKLPVISNVIQLKPEQNNISFTYKSIDLNYPKRIQYQWRLNESASVWSSTNNINFANLNAGDYTFSIVSRNGSKQQSKPTIFHFFIDKPIYKKVWFISAISIVVLLLILLIITNYIQQIKKKSKDKIDKLSLENHLINLEQKALQLQMNPHFIFNVLNGIKALGNKGNTKELNATVTQFATLLRAILNNSRKDEISLLDEINTLKNYLDLEQKISSNAFKYNFETNTNNIDLEEILIPPMLLQPFIENSVKHGFKGINKTGDIIIRFTVKNNDLLFTIIDNGVGFMHSQKSKNSHKSIAIDVTKERIKNLSKYSNFTISETKENNQTTGTKVEFQIPLKTDY